VRYDASVGWFSRASLALTLALASCALVTDLGDLGGDAGTGSDATFESGADTSATDGGDASTFTCDPIEGGKTCSPGEVDCFGYGECGGKEICCSTFGCIDGGLTGKCLQMDGGYFACDETTDCPGQQCCYGHSSTDNRLGARCNVQCSIDPDDVTACKQDSECAADLLKCIAVLCEGTLIQSCGGKCPK
jgi:hypothetical protein